MIRELISAGLFVLGSAAGTKRSPRLASWDLPLDAAMAKIEDAYVTHFDDVWGWRTMCWLDLTDEGEKLALELYHADEPGPQARSCSISALSGLCWCQRPASSSAAKDFAMVSLR